MIRPAACNLFQLLAQLYDATTPQPLEPGVYVRLTASGGGAIVTTPDGVEGYSFREGNLLAQFGSLGLLGEVPGEMV